MSLIHIMRKLYGKMRGFLSPEFNISIDKQKTILDAYPEPKDDIERSYYQYKVTMKTNGKTFSFLLNFISIPLSCYYMIELKRKYKDLIKQKDRKSDGVFLTNGIIIETIPNSLRKEFPNILIENFTDSMCLSKKDIIFLKQIFRRYPLAFHFHLKSIIKVGIYSAQIVKHSPKAIISYTEGSFTSSVATAYCEGHGIEHINIMHGERHFSAQLSFFRFSRYYVWDQYYIDLFVTLRVPITQFIIELPNTLKRNLCVKENIGNYLTYYLADEKKDTLLLIKECIDKLEAQGKNCAIRIHPRWSKPDLVKQIFKGYNIEEAERISIKESLENTKHVTSLRSTVLFEGYCNGKEVIIDDVTQPSKFETLQELRYIMLSRPHKLLSEILEDIDK